MNRPGRTHRAIAAATLVAAATVVWVGEAKAQNRVETVDVSKPMAVPEQVETLSSEELDAEGVATVQEALLMLTGAQQVPGTGTSSQLSIDGLPSGYLTVMRDGVPIGRAVGGPNGPGLNLANLPIDPDSIERIDVKRGMGPSGTSGVIVNIVTKRDRSRASVTSRVGAHDGGVHRSEVTGTAFAPMGKWGANAEATLLDRNGADADGDGQTDSPSGQSVFAAAGLSWRDGTDSLQFESRFNTGDQRVDGGAGPLDDRIQTDEVSGALNGTWQGSWGRITHSTWGGRVQHDFEKIVRSNGFVRPKASTESYRLGQDARATFFAGSHDITVAGDFRGEWVSREGETGDFDDAFVGEAGLSVGERWYVNRHVELSARLRGAYAEPWGLAGEAEAGAGFNFGDGYFGNLTVSQTRRLPTTEELFLFFDHSEVGYAVVGNDQLGPEFLRSLATEWGYGAKKWKVSVGGFGHIIDNGIITTSAPGQGIGTFTYENGGRLYLAGVRAQAEAALGAGLRLRVAHTYQPLAQTEEGERVPLRSEHNYRAELIGTWFQGGLMARTWVDGQAFTATPPGSPPVPDFAQVNVGVRWRPVSWGEIGMDFRNLADVRDPTWGPVVGRFALLTVGMQM
jgi:outer membrane receptor for ferrienterochelin and colicins